MRRNGDLPIRGARIAQLIETDGPGGAERILAHLATELVAAGCPGVAFLPAEQEGWLSRQLAAAGIPVEYFRLERPLSPKLARALADGLRRHRIDLAHSHEFTMGFYGAWAARKAGVPHVLTMHGGRYYAARVRRRLALRAAVARSGGVVAVSHVLARQLARDLWIPPARIATIPNGIRFAAVAHSTLRAELALAPDDHLIVAVGNLYLVKGHRYLLEAVAQLSARRPNLHVAIAGRGDLAAALAQQAQQLGLPRRLHLLGLRSDVANVLAAADIFVLPSLSEGLPLALLEAMTAGRPIVASAVGEVPVALVAGAAGLLVPPGDPAALASALDRLLTNPSEARRLAESARARAAAEYGSTRMVARYAALYEPLLAERGAARAQS
ncbi:MAG TPA: glycosyltransferase family 4 protein [Gemmatimonadales bacterium]|nr:glycosyltransferase family 4 protein [Gemmatimonadales bacterium]